MYGQIAVEVSVKNQDKHFKLQMISLATFTKIICGPTTELTGRGIPMREAIRVAMSACRKKYYSVKLCTLYKFYIANIVMLT